MSTAKEILKQCFGYSEFRYGQEKLIDNIVAKRDTLGIMPTGAGKSLCYQIPAMIFEGVTIVISPLISLMKDQVDGLNEIGIPAGYINSSLGMNEYNESMYNLLQGKYKIVYVAPERIENATFINMIKDLNVSMIAIDEAHCVSQWGHDFRPSYKEIPKMIKVFSKRPVVVAFTATATAIVKQDIINLLELQNPYVLVTGFDRENLIFSVENVVNKRDFLLKYLEDKKDKSGIIYCLTRKNVDQVYELLKSKGYEVSRYHAGLSDKERSKNQEDFIYDRKSIMVATNAFGMGIDKSNIRYVVHYNMPRTMENYYQEAGRAGRDGVDAECVLLYSRADVVANKYLIEMSKNNYDSKIKEYDKLSEMVNYCNTDKCLRKYILEYFNETVDYDNCNKCGNCLDEIEITDITIESQKILSCIKRLNGKYGAGLVTDVLKGANTAKIRNLGFDTLSTYGIMRDCPKDTIREIIDYLITEEYITVQGDKYAVLMLAPKVKEILFEGKQVYIKRKIKKEERVELLQTNEGLFEALKDLRKELSVQYNIPPFIIVSDHSLIDMAKKIPITKEELLDVAGIGTYKMEKYGELFISRIKKYILEHPETQKIVLDNKLKSELTEEEKVSTNVKKSKEDTNMVTYDLYKLGNSMSDIAKIRGLTMQTIESHYINLYKRGFDVDIENYINLKNEDIVRETINEYGISKLKTLKENLPEEVTYTEIKYFIAKMEKENEI